MLPISEANFLVVDVETTGADPILNRITDVACIVVRNFEIVDEYQSLVNPHQIISPFIQNLTNITHAMVYKAPEAKQVFANIGQMMTASNSFFVAHNANFDWRFISETLKREDIDYDNIPVICTLKLAKKLLPLGVKKNVGALAKYYNIPIAQRHRAYGDAFATANFFIEFLYILTEKYGLSSVEDILNFQDTKQPSLSKINQQYRAISKTRLKKLTNYIPNTPRHSGVVTFIGQNGEILYITKSNDMQNFMSELVEFKTFMSNRLKSALKKFERIEFTPTYSELETNVTEIRKIKQLKPIYTSFKPLDISNADDITINEYTSAMLTANLSMLILREDSEQEKTIEIAFIKNGLFEKLFVVGTKSNLMHIFDVVNAVYYEEQEESVDMDETKVISHWLKKYEATTKIIRIDKLDLVSLCDILENEVRLFYTTDDSMVSDRLRTVSQW